MEKVIRFSEYKQQIENMVGSEYRNIEEASNILALHDLRYVRRSGRTIDNHMTRSEYSNSSEIPLYTNVNDILKFELLPFLKNECKRIDYFKQQGKKYYY